MKWTKGKIKTVKILIVIFLALVFSAGIFLAIMPKNIMKIIAREKLFVGEISSEMRWVLGFIGVAVSAVTAFFVIRNFYKVPEEERWLIEGFGKYYRTAGPGLIWLCPLLDKAKAYISVWTQKYRLFEKTIKIDFIDGSAVPKEAYVYVQADMENTKRDRGPEGAPYKMVYGVEDIKGAVVSLIENAVRSHLNSLTIDQGLTGGRGGYNIAEKLPPNDKNGIERRNHN